ncbi:hypothetical protein [Eubacterium sp.]
MSKRKMLIERSWLRYDILVMLLTNSYLIRDVLLFPIMKPIDE